MPRKSYSDEEKKNILDQLREIHSQNGKLTNNDFNTVGDSFGGISLITLKNWADAADIQKINKRSKPNAPAASTQLAQASLPSADDLIAIADQTMELDKLKGDLVDLEKQVADKKSEIETKEKEIRKKLGI